MTTSTKRKRAAAVPMEIWRERVTAWRASGQPAAEFARDKDFAALTLERWAHRLARAAPRVVRVVPTTAPPPPAATPAPPPVAPPPRPAAPADLVVEVGAARVRVAPGFDPALLLDLVAVLGGLAR